ncbi:MAG: hypothetical protein FJY67_02300 [Calditrichaeota bacterium]|nr:hypothetical protein [Calditrichota bacterium]
MIRFFIDLWRVVVEHRKPLLLTTGGIVIFVAIVNGGYYFYSARPESCLVCHYMQPFYDQWRNSAHRDVNCTQCHPGRRTLIDTYLLRYLTNSYRSRPHANVTAATCLKCHDESTLVGEITYQRGIKFNHEHHLGQMRRGKKLRCTSCHATGMPDSKLSVDNEACYLCHFMEAAQGRAFTSCNACHGIPTVKVEHQGFQFNHQSYVGPEGSGQGIDCSACHVSVVSGGGAVPEAKCYECHKTRVDIRRDLDAVHRLHITEQGVDCFRCHDRIEHGKVEMSGALSLDCAKCHAPEHGATMQMFMGTGGEGVADHPDAMFLSRVSCEACHTPGAVQMNLPGRMPRQSTFAEKRQTCVYCHGAGYDRMLDDWKVGFDRLVSELRPLVAAVKAPPSSYQNRERMFVSEALRKARVNFDLLVEGKAVHNPFYALSLARQIFTAVDSAAVAKGTSRPTPPQLLTRADAACMLCHTARPPAAEMPFSGATFSHELHVEGAGLSCTQCHSSTTHRTQDIDRSTCVECHENRFVAK